MTQPRRVRYLCLGGGTATGAVIDELLHEGVKGSDICLVSGEPEMPYHRPSLSKGFLTGQEEQATLYFQPADFYIDQGVMSLLETKVTKFLPTDRRVLLDTGEIIEFDSAVLATGSRPRQLSLPGSDLHNITYLRTVADSLKLKKVAKKGQRAVIVGAGFIGMEVAASLRTLGLEVTVLHRGNQLFDRFATPELAAFFQDYFLREGVDFRFRETLDHCEGEAGIVTHVVTSSGEKLPADIVLLGVGVELNLDYLADQHAIGIENGILVDDELETAVPGIFAVGDIANFPDVIFQSKRRRIEHWDHAIETGKVVAHNLLGRHETYTHLSYFFSDMFDLSFELWGDTDDPDDSVFVGDLDRRTAACWYLRNGQVSAYFAINRSDEEKNQAQTLITSRQPINKQALEEQTRS